MQQGYVLVADTLGFSAIQLYLDFFTDTADDGWVNLVQNKAARTQRG